MNEVLLQYGALGVMVIGLTIGYLKRDKDYKDAVKQSNDIQESRLRDAKETRDKLAEQMEMHNQTISLIYEKLRDSKRGS